MLHPPPAASGMMIAAAPTATDALVANADSHGGTLSRMFTYQTQSDI
jgi:hypothetical protein